MGTQAEILFPDMHAKMAKKITQLTKVIYHLNTNKRDAPQIAQDDLAGLGKGYETEIDLILKDCYSKVNKFREKLEERQAVDREQKAVDSYQKQHAAERKEALKEFEEYKKRSERNVNSMRDRCDKMREEMETVKLEFKSRVDQFTQVIKKLEGKSDELTKKHAKEMSDHVKESNQKYNEMLKERLDAEEELRSMLEKKMVKAVYDAKGEADKRVKALEEEIQKREMKEVERIKAEHNKILADLKEEHAQRIQALHKELDALSGKGNGAEKSLSDALKHCEKLRAECDTLRDTLRERERHEGDAQRELKGVKTTALEAKSRVERLEEELHTAVDEASMYKSKCAGLEERCKVLDETIRKKEEETLSSLALIKKDLGRSAEELQTQLDLKVAELNRTEALLKERDVLRFALDTEVQGLRSANKKMEEEIRVMVEEQSRSKDTILKMTQDLSVLMDKEAQKQQDSEKMLQDKLKDLTQQLAEVEGKLVEVVRERDELKKQAQHQSSLKDAAQVDSSKKLKESEAAAAKLKSDLDGMKKALEKEQSKYMESSKELDKLKARLSELGQALAEKTNGSSAEIQKLKDEIGALRKENARLEENVRQLSLASSSKSDKDIQEALDQLRDRMAGEASSERERLDAQIKELENSREADRLEHQQTLGKLQIEHLRAMEELSKELADGKRDQEMKIKALDDERRRGRDSIVLEVRAEFELKMRELESDRNRAESELSVCRKELESIVGRMQDEKRREVDELLADQMQQTKDLHQDFIKSQQSLADSYEQLQAAYEELQGRFERRESREEDLARIRSMEGEIAEWANKMKKAEEDVRFYKLEIVNREEALTQNFKSSGGHSMSVGVMDPLAFKKAKSMPGEKGTPFPPIGGQTKTFGTSANFSVGNADIKGSATIKRTGSQRK